MACYDLFNTVLFGRFLAGRRGERRHTTKSKIVRLAVVLALVVALVSLGVLPVLAAATAADVAPGSRSC